LRVSRRRRPVRGKQVRPEDAVVAPYAWRLIGDWFEGEPLPSGDVRLLGVREPLPLRPLDNPRLSHRAEPVVRGSPCFF
jgi:hypothetical protein